MMRWTTFVTVITMILAILSCLFICGIPLLTNLPSKDEKPAFISTSVPLALENAVLVDDPTSKGPPYYLMTNSVGTRLDEVLMPTKP